MLFFSIYNNEAGIYNRVYFSGILPYHYRDSFMTQIYNNAQYDRICRKRRINSWILVNGRTPVCGGGPSGKPAVPDSCRSSTATLSCVGPRFEKQCTSHQSEHWRHEITDLQTYWKLHSSRSVFEVIVVVIIIHMNVIMIYVSWWITSSLISGQLPDVTVQNSIDLYTAAINLGMQRLATKCHEVCFCRNIALN